MDRPSATAPPIAMRVPLTSSPFCATGRSKWTAPAPPLAVRTLLTSGPLGVAGSNWTAPVTTYPCFADPADFWPVLRYRRK